jgi:hypothetical protein
LQKRLAEANAADAARKKPPAEMIPKGTMVVDGLVIDEWVSQVHLLILNLQILLILGWVFIFIFIFIFSFFI